MVCSGSSCKWTRFRIPTVNPKLKTLTLVMIRNVALPLKLLMWSFVEVLPHLVSFLNFGSNSYWFGLSCPAHCQASFTFNLALFSAGLGFGCVACFGFVWFFVLAPATARPAEAPAPGFRQVPRPGALRLRGYLHEPGAGPGPGNY